MAEMINSFSHIILTESITPMRGIKILYNNSSRTQFYYDSVSIFFYDVLHPPQIPTAHSCKLEKYYDLGDLKIGAGMDESLLYEISTSIRSASSDAASSSSAPPAIATTKSVDALLSEIGPVASIADSVLYEDNAPRNHDSSDSQDRQNDQNVECCSYTSSNEESWGRCSSLGGSDEESSADCSAANNSHENMKQKITNSTKEDKRQKKKAPTAEKKPKSEKREKLEGPLVNAYAFAFLSE